MSLIAQHARAIGHKRVAGDDQKICAPALMQVFQVLGVVSLQDAVAEPSRTSAIIQTLKQYAVFYDLVQHFQASKTVSVAIWVRFYISFTSTLAFNCSQYCSQYCS